MNDQPIKKLYWATTGAKATCTAGHTIAVFAEPLKDGEPIDTTKLLTGWNLTDNERISGLCPCGQPWRSGWGSAMKLHVAYEWVPGEQPKAETVGSMGWAAEYLASAVP